MCVCVCVCVWCVCVCVEGATSFEFNYLNNQNGPHPADFTCLKKKTTDVLSVVGAVSDVARFPAV